MTSLQILIQIIGKIICQVVAGWLWSLCLPNLAEFLQWGWAALGCPTWLSLTFLPPVLGCLHYVPQTSSLCCDDTLQRVCHHTHITHITHISRTTQTSHTSHTHITHTYHTHHTLVSHTHWIAALELCSLKEGAGWQMCSDMHLPLRLMRGILLPWNSSVSPCFSPPLL